MKCSLATKAHAYINASIYFQLSPKREREREREERTFSVNCPQKNLSSVWFEVCNVFGEVRAVHRIHHVSLGNLITNDSKAH